MATQTVQFIAQSGLTLSVKLYARYSDTVVDTQSATEATNRKGTYTVAFTDETAGYYEIVASVGNQPFATYEVYLEADTGTYRAFDPVDTTVTRALNTERATYSYSDTVLNSSTSDPVEGATVEVFFANTTSPLITSDTTASDGTYTVRSTSAGPYDIRIIKSGFNTVTVEDVTFTAS